MHWRLLLALVAAAEAPAPLNLAELLQAFEDRDSQPYEPPPPPPPAADAAAAPPPAADANPPAAPMPPPRRKKVRRRRPPPPPRPPPANVSEAEAKRRSASVRRCAAGDTPRATTTRTAQTPNVLLVVPGVLDARRAANVRRNWRAVRPRRCLALTWRRCGEDADLDEALDGPLDGRASEPPLGAVCSVVRAATAGNGYVHQMKHVLPSFVDDLRFDWVFVVLDDVVLNPGFDLPRLARVARKNGLAAASPAIERAHARKFPDMVPRPLPGAAVGRRVDVLEFFAVLYTPAAYRCLYDLLDADLNALGYGYPAWLPVYCRARPGLDYAAGVVDALVATHGDSRADARSKSYSDREAQQARSRMRAFYSAHDVALGVDANASSSAGLLLYE